MARPKKSKKMGRGAKGWETRRANIARKVASIHENMTEAGLRNLAAASSEATQWATTALGAAPQMGTQEIPGRGDIVGGYDDRMAIEIVNAARKKTGDVVEDVKRLVQCEAQRSRAEGISEQRDHFNKVREVQSRIMSYRIVCGFVAEVKNFERVDGIPYEMIWSMNSLTLMKVVEALERAGYHPHGKIRAETAE